MTTHEYAESALKTALALLKKTTPENQPSDGFLRFVDGLLDRHHKESELAQTGGLIAELTERLDRLEKAVSFSTLGNRKK